MDFENQFQDDKYFTLACSGRTEKLFYGDIIYIKAIEGSDNKVEFKTADKAIRVTGSLEKIRELLDDRFYTCRQGFDVNITKVDSFLNGIVNMEDGSTVQMVQRKCSEFRKVLLNYLEPDSILSLD
jgi:DNA-binding LytR/AlgR family response regulator